MKQKLWTEKYRPISMNEYVFPDENIKAKFQQFIDEGELPNLMFVGSPGTGKTTAAKMLLNEIGTSNNDIKYVKSSLNNNVDYLRDQIYNFIITPSMDGGLKYVLLDEADYLSPSSQSVLRHLTADYLDACRFIITANYPERIIPALHSRFQTFKIYALDKDSFTEKIVDVCLKEGVQFSVDEIYDYYITLHYPDVRKCLNAIQQNIVNGALALPSQSEDANQDWKIDAISLLKDDKILEARKLICNQLTSDEVEDFFKFCFNNIDLWVGDDIDKQREAIIIVKNGMANIPLVADHEINVTATLCELELLRQ